MSLLADMAKNPKRQKTAAPQPIASTSKKESEDEEDSDTAENNLLSVVEGQTENQEESENSPDVILAEIASAPVSEELASVLKGRFDKKN